MPRIRIYQPIEMCVCFNFDTLFANIHKEVVKKFGDGRENDHYKEEVTNSLKAFSLNGQQFTYQTMTTNMGGNRWYVTCPRCGKPKRRLYLPDKYDDREQRYLCSTCHRLRTLSMINGKSPKYKTIIRPLKRMQALKEKLMKGNMKPELAAKLLDEYESIEKALKNSPDYRLWRFNVEHGDPREAGI
jgi:transposase-like protein